jgi:hypothetical protein
MPSRTLGNQLRHDHLYISMNDVRAPAASAQHGEAVTIDKASER